MGNKRIGVVTVTYNSSVVIDEFVGSVLRQQHADFLLYVVDNASSDDTLQRLEQFADSRIIVIRNLDNLGVAEGNNIGIRAALRDECDSVLLINNDTCFDPELFSTLLRGLEIHECQMVVPKILYFDDPGKIWSAGGYLSAFRGSARHFGFDCRDNGAFDSPRLINYNPTCCMLIKKEAFENIGLMDAKYFAYFDDTDFCLRANRASLRMFYIPEARLLHKVSMLTGGSESEFTIRYSTRNHVYYVLKNFTPLKAFSYLVAFQAHVIVKYLFLQRRVQIWRMAERAFSDGLRMSRVGRDSSMTQEPVSLRITRST